MKMEYFIISLEYFTTFGMVFKCLKSRALVILSLPLEYYNFNLLKVCKLFKEQSKCRMMTVIKNKKCLGLFKKKRRPKSMYNCCLFVKWQNGIRFKRFFFSGWKILHVLALVFFSFCLISVTLFEIFCKWVWNLNFSCLIYLSSGYACIFLS